MPLDRSFVEQNRISTQRLRDLAGNLSDDDLNRPVGPHWTVAVALAHIAFWDARVLAILDASEQAGAVIIHTMDIVVNDLSLPLWRAVQPREAVRIALETADQLDQRLETFPSELLDQIAAANIRFVRREVHRLEHLREIEAALHS